MSSLKVHKQAPALKRMKVREIIALHQEILGIKSADLAVKLGYDNANIVSMLKAGTMTLPNNKIEALASALGLDPLYVAQSVNEESNFQLSGMLEAISKRTPITLNEEKLILSMREVAAGRDINHDKEPELRAQMLALHKEIADRVVAPGEEILTQLRTNPRAAISKPDPKPRRKPTDGEQLAA
jgi:hypothetical protein